MWYNIYSKEKEICVMKQYTKKGNYSRTYVKFMRGMYNRYIRSTQTQLEECYERPSIYKFRAMERVKQRAETTPYIISYNCHYFTVAYFTTEDEMEYFCVDTGRNIYTILSTFL